MPNIILTLQTSKDELLKVIQKVTEDKICIVGIQFDKYLIPLDPIEAFVKILKILPEGEKDAVLNSNEMQEYYRYRIKLLLEKPSIIDDIIKSQTLSQD